MFSQFFTKPIFSDLLVNEISILEPRSVLELGVGDGAILNSVKKRWSKAEYTGLEIDPLLIEKVNSCNLGYNIINKDCSSLNLDIDFIDKKSFFDVGVCNPPFHEVDNNDSIRSLLEEVNLRYLIDKKSLTLDVVFLLQNLLFLKEGGELGIVVPDGIATNIGYRKLRAFLLENFTIRKVVQLPSNGFKKTAVQTHIMILEKGFPKNDFAPLFISDCSGLLTNRIDVNLEFLERRMDYSFHFWRINSRNRMRKGLKLKDLNPSITRGKFSKRELISKSIPFIHTNNISESGSLILMNNKDYGNFNSELFNDNSLVRQGDVLITRVGKKCVGRSVLNPLESALISDCIIRVRLESKDDRVLLINSLNSSFGRGWLKANSHGTCARSISMKDLLEFPLLE